MSIEEDDRAGRRTKIVGLMQAETGIDDDMIERLVCSFYAGAREDALLGPVFAARIDDWEPHIRRICAFWSSVMLMTGDYHGQPMRVHLPLPIGAAHFDRWLELFADTARAVCPPAAAERFVDRARRIGQSLELGIAMGRGVRLARGERLPPPAPA